MTTPSADEHEALLQFLYQAPIGLVQTTRAGDITMMNPMATQLLMPLAPEGDLDNLFEVLQPLAPQLRQLVAEVSATSGMVLDGLRLPVGSGARTRILSLRLFKLSADALMASVSDASAAVGREERRLALQLDQASRIDHLTALPNRTAVLDQLAPLLASPAQSTPPGDHFALLLLNCDRFQRINDAYGRAVGDDLLRRIAARLGNLLRSQDALDCGIAAPPTTARLGSDEFAVLLQGMRSADDALAVGQRLVHLLGRPYLTGQQQIDVSLSMGIVPDHHAHGHADEVLHNASIAMREAKRRGGRQLAVFEPAMRERAALRGNLEAELRVALQEQQLQVVYQPLVDLRDKRCTGVEALVRWQHPVRGLVSPVEFIDLAEETGLIHGLGAFVLAEACRQFAAWQQALGAAAPRKLSVNLSRAQLSDPGLIAMVQRTLALNALDARQLQLEITESLAAQGDQVQQRLHALKGLGLALALDDFGTGFSSLSSLHLLPVDVVKIDRSFVSQAETSTHHRVLIQATINVAASLGMATVAEGVETAGQAAILAQLGCETGQGYLYSKPLPPEVATPWLVEHAARLPSAP